MLLILVFHSESHSPWIRHVECRYSLLSRSPADCIAFALSLRQRPSAPPSPQPTEKNQCTEHNPQPTCALSLCLVCVVSLPTLVNTTSVQEEKRGLAKAALVRLAALQAALVVTP